MRSSTRSEPEQSQRQPAGRPRSRPGHQSLGEALATPGGKHRYVAALFGRIAHRYDLITVLLSYGQDRRWKAALVERAAVEAGERAVDLACGTGDLTFAVAARGASVVGLDFAPEMVRRARAKRRPETQEARFVVGDMLKLPLPDASQTLVTAGYALRNAAVLETALGEIYRVLAPGGRVLALDFNRPANRVVRATYLAYLTLVGSTLGVVLHGDPDTYRYIPASLARYPGAADVAARMTAIGFAETEWRPLLGGLMAINVGRKSLAPRV